MPMIYGLLGGGGIGRTYRHRKTLNNIGGEGAVNRPDECVGLWPAMAEGKKEGAK
jgi:hypothetical protein